MFTSSNSFLFVFFEGFFSLKKKSDKIKDGVCLKDPEEQGHCGPSGYAEGQAGQAQARAHHPQIPGQRA